MASKNQSEPRGTAPAVEPGEPEETPALSQLGATFAERAKAVQKAENKSVQPRKTTSKRK